jgi:RNA polymerase sigma-70 factor (sigma-E family)
VNVVTVTPAAGSEPISPNHWGGPRGADARLGMLFDSSYPAMVRLAHLLVNDRGTAEDIAQEAFVRLHGRLGGLADPYAAGGYLRHTVVNLCRSHHRRQIIRRRHQSDEAWAVDSQGHSDDRLSVLAALRTLPRRQRECLVLRYYLDLSEDEIARTLRISPGSVKTHSARGRSTLARLLGEDE